MSSKALKAPAASLYDEDFAVWAAETARLLRARRFAEIDIEHAAEEIEDMGKSQVRELGSRLRVLLVHLLKWKWQPEKRSRSCQSTIDTQRAELETLFGQSPSLRRQLPDEVRAVYRRAARGAAIQTGLPIETFPRTCPFSAEQVLDEDFLPE
jgi:hypothetical protein